MRAPKFTRHRFIGSVIAALLATFSASAQTPALDMQQGGEIYLIAFPDTVGNVLSARYPDTRVAPRASLWIYSPVTTKVRIRPSGSTVATTITVNADEMKIYELGSDAAIGVYNTVTAKTYHVEADQPVIITCFYATIQGMEAFTPLPIEGWGNTYYAASIPGELVFDVAAMQKTGFTSRPKAAPATILIIAAYDNTRVTFGLQYEGNPPAFITLNEGQAYQLATHVDTSADIPAQEDMAAFLIQADKPIAVISGNTRAKTVDDQHGMLDNIYKNALAEWLEPAEMFGRRFVWTPTYDEHRAGIGAPAERKREFARVYSLARPTTAYNGNFLQPGGSTKIPFAMKPDTLIEFAFGAPNAVYFETERPSQVLMHSSGFMKFNGSTPGPGNVPIIDNSGWAPYMVNVVPVERWTTFAAYYAPADADSAGKMKHYINVVTDTASAKNIVNELGRNFPFTRKIPGTPFIWGTDTVVPGVRHWLYGRFDARFSGHVYGLLEGNEHFIPGGSQGEPLARYSQYNALSYGYPLSALITRTPTVDSLDIDASTSGCGELAVVLHKVDVDSTGLNVLTLRSITLDPSDTVNASLVPVNPVRISDVLGRSSAEVHIRPLDTRYDAHAVLIIKDRTGRIWRVPYAYQAEHAAFGSLTAMDFGGVTLDSAALNAVIITNPTTHPITITALALEGRVHGFSVDTAGLHLPQQLAPGAFLNVPLTFAPHDSAGLYMDSLRVTLACGLSTLALRGRALARPAGVDVDARHGAALTVTLGNGVVHIDYLVRQRGDVRVELFDALGRQVALPAAGTSDAGTHHAEWAPATAPSGVYYCRLSEGGATHVATFVLRR